VKATSGHSQPSVVAGKNPAPQQDGDIRDRWSWVEASVWMPRMLKALERGMEGNSTSTRRGSSPWSSSTARTFNLRKEQRRLESRMREIRQSGSGGGAVEFRSYLIKSGHAGTIRIRRSSTAATIYKPPNGCTHA
jgi:hypothetical protein